MMSEQSVHLAAGEAVSRREPDQKEVRLPPPVRPHPPTAPQPGQVAAGSSSPALPGAFPGQMGERSLSC